MKKTGRRCSGGAFHRGRIRLASSQVGAVDAALQPRWSTRRRVDYARDLLTRLSLASLITHRIPFERAAVAYALVEGLASYRMARLGAPAAREPGMAVAAAAKSQGGPAYK